jgi:hypothetical protein
MQPDQAARLAGFEAQTAVDAAKLAEKKAGEAAAARQRTEELAPDPHRDMLKALESAEQSAFLRFGPKRNRWRDLVEYEERLVEVEQRRTALIEEIGALNLQLREEPARHTTALARWMEGGEKGERPASRVPELEAAVADRQAEYEAAGRIYDQTLLERAEHVARNRKRFMGDVRKAKEKAEAKYVKLVDSLEATRRELLELRSTEVWAGLFPSELLASEPNVQSLAGAVKHVQKPLLPAIESNIVAEPLFELLRADAGFCSTVATVDQYAALKGVSTRELTDRVARWQHGETDFVGPHFPATWAGSAEETAQAERQRKYSEQLGKRLWGDG